MKRTRSVLSLVCIAAICGFPVASAIPSAKPLPTPGPSVRPRLTRISAIRLAIRAAERRYKLSEYEEPRKAEFDPKDHSWWIFFQAKARRPGGYFYVVVDDHTEKITIHEGE